MILLLSALGLVCWPSRPALLRMVGSVPPPPRSRPGHTPLGGRRPPPAVRLRDGPGGRLPAVLAVLTVGGLALTVGPAAGVAALLLATTVAALTSAGRRRRRERQQVGLLLVATRTLAREVRTGSSPMVAVLATAAAHPGCAAALEALAVAVVARRGGAPASASRVGLDHQAGVVARLGEGWQLSARHGVPWAVLIDTVATDLDDRQKADAARTAQVAGPRVSGYVLAVMPALGILLGAGMGADPVHVLLQTGVGSVLLLVGTALTCLGLAWTASIVRS